MPDNENPHVLDLLSWHGHDSGGVRVPFRGGGEPIGRVLETSLVRRLKETASAIASGTEACRWIFLVGGPGNGKSQMVEVFLRALGADLECEDALVQLIGGEFARTPIPRIVTIDSSSGSALSPAFADRVGRLAVVQDASASDDADGDAAEELANDIAQLLTDESDPPSVFICCANRGLLTRAMAAAAARNEEAFRLLEAVVRATGLGAEALASPLACWPLALPPELGGVERRLPGLVGCWPLDIESLLLGYEEGDSAVDTIVEHAVAPERWEATGCDGCTSQSICPLFTNATWLRNDAQRRSLLGLLRRAELATGQRWNFRAVFSLVAELLVGERDDFSEGAAGMHPCQWVHIRRAEVSSQDAASGICGAVRLVKRLYPQALFPTRSHVLAARAAEFTIRTEVPVTAGLAECLRIEDAAATTSTRRRLRDVVAPVLDPGAWSPSRDDHELSELENAYAQALDIGRRSWPAEANAAPVEERLLELLESAEAECDDEMQGIYAAGAGDAIRFIRQMACRIAKRSVGVRLGLHGHDSYLKEYEATIRDAAKLNALQAVLRQLLGQPLFEADMLESFGQAQSEELALVILKAPPMRIRSLPAPVTVTDRPAHDLPVLLVANYPVALTFGLYEALELKREGCASGSLPASVRALLDRLRQVHAGEKCRSERDFLEQGAIFEVRGRGIVTVDAPGAIPRFIA